MEHRFRYRPGEIVPGTGLKVIRPLGSGGMGAVYEVEETSVEAPFVMKVIHPELLRPGSHAADRMRQEAKTQARLNHKNIVRVYRAGVTAESPPLPFYVMDRLSGYTVRHVLGWHRSKGMLVPLSWVFWIGSNLLQALEHAHKNGVIHRDVKPDNIFIHHAEGQKPIAKLLDFGIMAAVSEFADKTRLTAGGFAGTYTHAAPEQLQGAPPSPAMDIYAVGMVLYQLLAGRHPFEDRKTPEAIVHAHLLHMPPPISERPGLHPKLERLVFQMLAKDPKQRPKSAQEALNELARIKTEWMQQSSDGSDVIDFQFDADIGERWPTNVNGDDDFSLESGSERKLSAEARADLPALPCLKDRSSRTFVLWSSRGAMMGKAPFPRDRGGGTQSVPKRPFVSLRYCLPLWDLPFSRCSWLGTGRGEVPNGTLRGKHSRPLLVL